MLKLQYFATCCEELTHWKRSWCWKRLRAGGEGGLQWMRWLDWITDSMGMSLSKVRKVVKDREACCTVVHEVTKSQIWPSDWTTTEILKESQMTVFDYNKMMTFWFVKDSNHVIKERLAHYKNTSVIYIIYNFIDLNMKRIAQNCTKCTKKSENLIMKWGIKWIGNYKNEKVHQRRKWINAQIKIKSHSKILHSNY